MIHTHSPYAEAWVQVGEVIPRYCTTHSDYFYECVPCTQHLTA
ncbi:class II aldolase/adducin family protein [Lawsonibacter faecis]